MDTGAGFAGRFVRLGEWGVNGCTRLEWAHRERPSERVVIIRTPDRNIAAAWSEVDGVRYHVGPKQCVAWSGRDLSDLGEVAGRIGVYGPKWPLHGGWKEVLG